METEEALHNLESIINASDGIMIDRGDLASAIGVENLPRFQKKIITECNYAAKPVIVATEMLMSMVENKEPTKAEILDIANAVADGTDDHRTSTGKPEKLRNKRRGYYNSDRKSRKQNPGVPT